MNPLFTVLSVAKFESIVLLRSWFLRIFILLAVIVIGLLDLLFFAALDVFWTIKALPSFIPYLNLLFLNVMQAVAGVFLAAEFLKDDRKLDITEVIYPHPMTNTEYVLGKMLGVIGTFGALNILILGLGLIFNVFFSSQPVSIAAYFWYPLLISLPTLVFLFGLSFLLMMLIRNQALTIILLLGYIIATLFYLGKFHQHLYDYTSYGMPLTYSDFVGFGDLSRVLIQRGIYLLLGLGFTLLTALLLHRLPQSRLASRLSLITAVASIAGALYLGSVYLRRISDETGFRARVAQLNAEIRKSPVISLRKCGLTLEHKGGTIEARAALRFANRTSGPLETYVFSLNPGLEVSAVERGGAPVPFERDLHILKVRPSAALAPGEEDSLTVSYRGRIDERVCYPDIDPKERKRSYRILLYNIDKRYAIIQPDYVLLTPESLWYPRAGLSEGAAWPEVPPLDFVDFSLRVKTAAGLRAVSQGAAAEKGPGEFEFRPETPLPGLSLALGHYEMRSLAVVDSTESGDSTKASTTEYTLYYLKGHDFFSKYFTELDSTLPGLIRGARAQYENKLGLEYPYRRLSLVETPLQFFAYHRLWKAGAETVQPELVFVPEKLATMQMTNFKGMVNGMSRSGRRGGPRMSVEEIQSNIFQAFVNSNLLTASMPSRTETATTQGGMFSLIDNSDCSVLSLYHYYARHFSSAEWPLFNLALESCLSRQIVSEQGEMASVMFRGLTGMSMEDRANLALAERPIAEILARPASGEDVKSIMQAKCDYLFNYFRSAAGEKEFKAFLHDYLKTSGFADIDTRDFVSKLSTLCNTELSPYLDSWMHENRLPAFTFGSPRQYAVLDGDRTRYQLLLTVTNDSDTDGLVGLNFLWSASSNFEKMWGGRPENPANEKFYVVKAGQSKEIGILLDEEIHALWANSCLSRNLPSSMVLYFSGAPAGKDAKPFEGERVLAVPPVLEDPGTIIVDNEDPGFELQNAPEKNFLKRTLNGPLVQSFLKGMLSRPDSTPSTEKYVGLLRFRLPTRWRNALYGDFYGKYVHSGHYIQAGSGENRVSWKAELPRNGKYELSCHTIKMPTERLWGQSGKENKPRVKDFHFIVHDDEGAREQVVDLDGAEEGWYSLGTFNFPEGEAKLELTDQTKGQLVYADAVRWTLRD